MVRLTLIARVHDGLPLAEGLDGEKDRELETYKHQAKVNSHQGHQGPICCRYIPFNSMVLM